MLFISTKFDNTTGATGQLDASEFNDLEVELQKPIINSGQIGNVAIIDQLQKSMFIAGAEAEMFLDSGSANLIQITPFSGNGQVVFSTNFITGNTITITINGTPVATNYITSNAATYSAIQANIAAAFPAATVSANANAYAILIYQAGVVFTITCVVTGGASQPNNQVSNGLQMPDSYQSMNGFIAGFNKTVSNSSSTIQVNIGQGTGTLKGLKNLYKIGGTSLNPGDVGGYCRIRYNLAGDYWELLQSDNLNKQNIVIKSQPLLQGNSLNYKASFPYSIEMSYFIGTGATLQLTNRQGNILSAVPTSGTQFSVATDATQPKGSRKVLVSNANSTALLPIAENDLKNLGLGSGDYSISFWINVNASNAQNACLLQFGTKIQNWLLVNWVQASAKINITDSGGSILTSTNALSTNAWHMVTIKRASGTVTIYLDTVANGSAANATNYTGCGLTYISSGNASGSITNTLYGSMSDLYVFNRTLATAEITALYTGGTYDSEIPYYKLSWSSPITATPVDSALAISRTLSITQPSAQDADISLLTDSNIINSNSTVQQQRNYVYAGGIPLMQGQALYYNYSTGFGDYRDYYVADSGSALTLQSTWLCIADYGTQLGSQLLDQIMPRSNTIIVAASDSSAKSAACADYLCTGYNDDVMIQAAISACSAINNGGRVILMEGTFNIYSNIVVASNVDIFGQGASTVIRRLGASMTQMIQVNNAVTNFTLSDFQIDGNSGNVAFGNNKVINCTNNTSNVNSKYQNISVINLYGNTMNITAFNNCVNMTNCSVVSDTFFNGNIINNCNNLFNVSINITNLAGGGTSRGFYNCNNLNNCYINVTCNNGNGPTVNGYESCNYLSNCTSVLTSTLNNVLINGFITCNRLSSCLATIATAVNNSIGFNSCADLTLCYSTAIGGGTGSAWAYNLCTRLSICEGYGTGGVTNANGIGFISCTDVSNCYGSGTGGGASGNGYGFQSCHHMSLNNGVGANGTPLGFKSCFVDRGIATSMTWSGAVAGDSSTFNWNTGTAAA